MKRIVTAGLMALALAVPAFSVSVISNEKMTFNIGGRMQALGYLVASGDTNTAATIKDATGTNTVPNGAQKDDIRPFLGLKMARLYLNGSFEKWRYGMEMAFGPETSVDGKASGAFVFLDLLDAYVDAPLFGNSYLRMGQFKVANGLESLTADTSLPFADFSLGNFVYQQGRDVGATIAINEGILSSALGLFVGAGRNIPERYLPTKVGVPGLIARVGIDTGISKDVLNPVDYYSPIEKAAFAIHGTFLYEKDSRVGHGTMFSQKKADAPLLMNSTWNRYMNTSWGYYAEYMQVGGDVQFKAPIGNNTLNIEAEGNYVSFTPTNFAQQGTNVTAVGGRVAATFSTPKVDFSVRYSILLPDQRFPVMNPGVSTATTYSTTNVQTANGTNYLTGSKTTTTTTNNYIYVKADGSRVTNQADAEPMHEVTLSAKIRFTEFFRVIVDVPLYFNMVRVYEAGNGPYMLADMPGQLSTIGGGNTANYYERVFVPELRVVAELKF